MSSSPTGGGRVADGGVPRGALGAPDEAAAAPAAEPADAAVEETAGTASNGTAPAENGTAPQVTEPEALHPEAPVHQRSTLRRLARLAVQRGSGSGSNPVLEPLIRIVRANHRNADTRTIEKAYEVAAYYHRKQRRKSGEPYITHPLAVTTILAELGMTTPTLVASLLHDTVEDTECTLDQLKKDFGDEVALLVDGVTKLDKVKYGQAAAEAETLRKMIIAMARDPRVLIIKLADRLHNMRTLGSLPLHKQHRKAKQTLEIYAPLAHRLGMNTIKWELEDLSFATLYPKRYDEIVRLVGERAPRRDEYLTKVVDQVQDDLRSAKIKATVTGRPKHYYSIYQKMIVRGRDFADIYDLVGTRVLVETVRDCYAVLGAVHARWNPVPGRFKDFIAMPKFNMYQSLHTTVIGPEGKPVELQIRTWAMHRRAEYGIAAHWKYKEEPDKAVNSSNGRSDGDFDWLQQLVDWQKETSDPGEFLDSLRFEINSGEVYVFTPKGDVLSFPQGATPVDFAFAVHTEVGYRCIGARVNGQLVPLDSTLDNGDVVEVFTSKAQTAGPSRDWLTFVKSARARNKIRQWFSKERREEAVDRGKASLARAIRKQGLPLQRILSGDLLLGIVQELRYTDISALYAAIGEGHTSAQSIVQRLVQSVGGVEGASDDVVETAVPTRPARKLRSGDPGVVVKGESDIWAKLAKCCTPVPGDEIIGFVTRGNGVSVHRKDCTNIENLSSQTERLVEVEWAPGQHSVFLVAIQVEALDRTRLLSDITKLLSDQHINILSASVSTTRDRVAISKFTFEMADPKHLGHLLADVRQVQGVYDAYRVTSGHSTN
ncbi:MAG: RelA/SpoT family protein [Streptosporangiales bacterium]|nr:RelA/SpoT family protein [Streptosporangiales bacterium]